MNSGHSRRPLVALVAAYAVALQALLAAFVPMGSVAATDPLAALCAHVDDAPGQQPVKHDLPCAAFCAAIGQSVSGPLPPAVAALAGPPETFVEIALAGDAVSPRLAWTVNHAPRGPPSVSAV